MLFRCHQICCSARLSCSADRLVHENACCLSHFSHISNAGIFLPCGVGNAAGVLPCQYEGGGRSNAQASGALVQARGSAHGGALQRGTPPGHRKDHSRSKAHAYGCTAQRYAHTVRTGEAASGVSQTTGPRCLPFPLPTHSPCISNPPSLSLCLSVCLSAYLPACLSACLPACLLAGLPACLPACRPVCLPACLSSSHAPACRLSLTPSVFLSRRW